MHIKDFRISRYRGCRKNWWRRAEKAIILELDNGVVLLTLRNAESYGMEVRRLRLCSYFISQVVFSLNVISEEESLENYNFTKHDVVRISYTVNWSGSTERNFYRCDPLTATGLKIHKLGTCSIWAELEMKYGRLQLSEIIWEFVEFFNEKFGFALEMSGEFLRLIPKDYEKSIEKAGEPLSKCVGFMYCTKIRMCRPSGDKAYKRSVYSGHKWVHY